MEEKHALGEKTIADVCEALIGASLLSGGKEHRFDMAVKAVTAFVNSESHIISSWRGYFDLYSLPSYQTQPPDGFELDLARNVEAKLGYHFTYPRLLRSAFTHPSYPSAWAKVPCYQRLEFLGDSLLDMVCVEDLFHRFPDRDPQWLTEHKVRENAQRLGRKLWLTMSDGHGLKQIPWRCCCPARTAYSSTTFQQYVTEPNHTLCRRNSGGRKGKRGRKGFLGHYQRSSKGKDIFLIPEK